MAPLRKIFSLPVSSGWNPVPTSSKLATRPLISTRPTDGSVIRDSTLRRVDLPAPLRPMMPTTSPLLISKLTFFSAQNSSISALDRLPRGAWAFGDGAADFCQGAGNHVAQSRVALALRPVSYQVLLSETFRADHDIGGHFRADPRKFVRFGGNNLSRKPRIA